jgi:hypothetical protein
MYIYRISLTQSIRGQFKNVNFASSKLAYVKFRYIYIHMYCNDFLLNFELALLAFFNMNDYFFSSVCRNEICQHEVCIA